MKPPGFTLLALIAFYMLLVAVPAPAALGEETKASDDVVFRWAFGALVGSEAERHLVTITRDTTLQTGDELKMSVDLRTSCFVYLIYRGSQGDVSLLFPGQAQRTAPEDQRPIAYYIPEGEAWFRLDQHTGLERFYLLASARPLTDLEALLNAYGSADPPDRAGLVDPILAHIKGLRRQHGGLKTRAERPVSIAGNVRGITSALDQIAVEISASGFFSKTYTIDHRE